MIADAHTVLAWVVVVANGAAGIWALGAHWVPRVRGMALWVLVGVAEVLLFVQVALGTARLSQLEGDAPQTHTFYGFLTLVAVAILYGMSPSDIPIVANRKWDMWINNDLLAAASIDLPGSLRRKAKSVQ